MAETPAIHVADEELAERIAESAAEGKPLRVEAGGKRYVLVVCRESEETSIGRTTGYDPEKVAEMLDKSAGAWVDLDVDRMICNLYKARDEGSRPIDRPRATSSTVTFS